MKKLVWVVGILALLGACNQQAETEEVNKVEKIEVKDLEDIEVFNAPDQTDVSVSEEEIKSSLQTYLDSSGDLNRAIYQLEDVMYSGEALDKADLETFQLLNTLIKENDENFSTYISNNTLPKEYKAEAEHISLYITESNQYVNGLDEAIDTAINEAVELELSLESIAALGDSSGIVNGREQAKIETFLEEKGIETNAFILDGKKQSQE